MISGDTIKYVGSEEGAKKACNADEKEIDGNGKMIIPAFLDSHVHAISILKTLWCLLLEQSFTSDYRLHMRRKSNSKIYQLHEYADRRGRNLRRDSCGTAV